MKPYQFLVSPDYLPKHFLEWYRLNTYLQRDVEYPIHLLMPSGQEAYQQTLHHVQPDIVYANPFDAGDLINTYHYRPVARPRYRSNEVVIFSLAHGSYRTLEDLHSGCVIAAVPTKDVEMVGLRLLEAVDLRKQDVNWQPQDYAQVVARKVRDREADVGFMLAEMYHQLEAQTRSRFHVLIESALQVTSHLFLVKESHQNLFYALQYALIHCVQQEKYRDILRGLNAALGYCTVAREDALFMMDILDTLRS